MKFENGAVLMQAASFIQLEWARMDWSDPQLLLPLQIWGTLGYFSWRLITFDDYG